MKTAKFDTIIIGGSYSGLAAAMALGRALKNVLVIDGGKPCNAQTPHSHNFLTQDGLPPAAIAKKARVQAGKYQSVQFVDGFAVSGKKIDGGFQIELDGGSIFTASKLIFATGITDIMPDIEGFAESWGISAIHCPYCHGYEVRHRKTGILGNGDQAFEFAKLISNWTDDLTVFTNGDSAITVDQASVLASRQIKIVEKPIVRLEQTRGQIENLVFADGSKFNLNALYSPRPFKQHSAIPEMLGCEMTPEGFIQTDALQETSVKGVYASGDNCSRMRTVANAVASGTTAGIAASKSLILEGFEIP